MKKRQWMQYLLAFLVDVLALTCSCILAWFIFDKTMQKVNYPFDSKVEYALSLVIAFLFSFLLFDQTTNIVKRAYAKETRSIVELNLVILGIQTLILMVTKGRMLDSRYMMFGVPLFNVLITVCFHVLLRQILQRPLVLEKMQDMTCIVTTTDQAEAIIKDLSSDWTKKLVGIALLDGSPNESKSILGVPVKAGADSFMDWIRRESVDEVYFKVPMGTGASMMPIVREVESMGATVHLNIPLMENLVVDAHQQELPAQLSDKIEYVAKSPMAVMMATRQTPAGVVTKRLLDIVGGLVGSIIAIPIILIVAIPQQIESRGPILFCQKRVGLNGRIFNFYKIRSMNPDADAHKKELMDQNEMNGLMFKMKDDPRVTKVGKFIRKTSLDEFPQFFSVLKGDMSLVGTRPPTLDEYERYQSHHKRRLSMKPGITGLWQVSGRSDMQDFEEIVELDVKYIDNWTFWSDIKILFKTVAVVLLHRGAQ